MEWAFGKDVSVCDGMKKKDGMGGWVFLGDVVVLLRIVLVPFHVVPGKESYAQLSRIFVFVSILDGGDLIGSREEKTFHAQKIARKIY